MNHLPPTQESQDKYQATLEMQEVMTDEQQQQYLSADGLNSATYTESGQDPQRHLDR